ncbi:MAG: hypothetical protein GY769_02700 [bacterium]|nr:hypothetical protein [bacterium]
MTHPFHPLHGREFRLADRRIRGTGGDRVYFYDDHGHLESMPVDWTDMAAAEPFVAISASRAHFRVEDLLRLHVLIESWTNPAPCGAGQRERSVK